MRGNEAVESSWGHGIMAMAAPGMAAADPFCRQPGTFDRAMLRQSFCGICGTGGMKTAGWRQEW